MYFDFDFNRDTAFFENSETMQYIKEQLKENKQLKNIEPHIVHASIQLWAESIIKHNLNINMTRVDHVNLISNQNSKEVFDTIGSIMFKSKDERSDADFNTLRMQGIVANYLDILVLSMDKDICGDLKKEFVQFKSLSPTVATKHKM